MVLVRMRACAWQLSARRLIALDARGIASIDRTQSTGVDEVRRDSDDWHHSHRLARRPQAGAGDPASWWSRARPDPLRVRDRQLVGSPAARRAARAVGMPLIDQGSIALPTINTSSKDQEGVGWPGAARKAVG